MIKLSIIITYYQTYDFTYKLLDVLSKQVTNEVEVILIDDGCNESRLDNFNFVKITHLGKNQGASHAYNVGLDQAIGKFIAFIDSDDMVTDDYISTLINAVDSNYADEIIFNFVDTKTNRVYSKPLCRAVWKAIYRKEIVPRFNEDFRYNTDLPFKNKLVKTPHSKYYLDKVLYYYNSFRSGSITWKKNRGMFDKENGHGKENEF